MKNFLPFMTQIEAAEAIDRGATALLPIGTVEGNGPVLPLGLDYLVSEAIAERVAERTDAVRLPSISIGVSGPIGDFAGTLYIPPETLTDQVESVLLSLVRSGWQSILIINNHLPNQYPVDVACRRVRSNTGVIVPSIFPAAVIEDLTADLYEGLEDVKGHGAEPGVSLMLHLAPDSVRLDAADTSPLASITGFQALSPLALKHENSRITVALNLDDVTETGAWGDPTQGSADRGAEIMSRVVDFTVSFVDKYQRSVGNATDHEQS